MTDDRAGTTFGVETIQLDLPPLVGALSRRLHEAGLPVTPARAADFARALALVRPVSRRRLYWTARAVFVSDPSQVRGVRRGLRRGLRRPRSATSRSSPTTLQTVAAPADDRPTAEHRTVVRRRRRSATPATACRRPRAGADDDDGAEVDVPLAMASDEERLATQELRRRSSRTSSRSSTA